MRPAAPIDPLGRLLAALLVALLVALLAAACEKSIPPKPVETGMVLEAVSFNDLPDWADDDLLDALAPLRRSCGKLRARPDGLKIGPDGLAGRVADWRPACTALAALPAADNVSARLFFETWFRPYLVTYNGSPDGLFTGYYEAELSGAFKPAGRYRVPLYGRPRDLVTVDLGRFRADLDGESIIGRVDGQRLVPYFSRAEIDDGALEGRRLELLWVDDPVDAFFLHIQGSGRVRLPDGRYVRVGFAASNGLPFHGIGRSMLAEKRIQHGDASMQGIRAWLRANPEEARSIMQRNTRFIFFRKIDGEGPVGAQNLPLTDGRSLAVDPAFLPLGAPLYLDTTWPASDRPLRRLFIAQDTGSAIKGAVRGDVYWGSGEAALDYAGRMKQKGRYYLLLPKTVSGPRIPTS